MILKISNYLYRVADWLRDKAIGADVLGQKEHAHSKARFDWLRRQGKQ